MIIDKDCGVSVTNEGWDYVGDYVCDDVLEHFVPLLSPHVVGYPYATRFVGP